MKKPCLQTELFSVNDLPRLVKQPKFIKNVKVKKNSKQSR